MLDPSFVGAHRLRGFIFTEFIELVEQLHGDTLADRLIDACELPSGGAYTSVDNYPAEELVALVIKLGELTDTAVATLLRTFGERLFHYLADSHRELVKGIHHPFDLFDCLEEHVHSEVRKLYPNAEVPFFDCNRLSTTEFRLQYRSERALPDLAEGLIAAACQHFGTTATIRQSDQSNGENTTVDFHVRLNSET